MCWKTENFPDFPIQVSKPRKLTGKLQWYLSWRPLALIFTQKYASLTLKILETIARLLHKSSFYNFAVLRSIMADKTQLQIFYVWFLKLWVKDQFAFIQQILFHNKIGLTGPWKCNIRGAVKLPKTLRIGSFKIVRVRELKGFSHVSVKIDWLKFH